MLQQPTPGSLTTRALLAGSLLLTVAIPSFAEFRLPPSRGEQGQPDVAADANGGLVVVWREHFPDSARPLNTIRFQRFAPDGEPVGGSTRVDLLPGDNARNPAVDVARDGSFVVVWEGGASEGLDRRTIWARRFAPDGSPRGKELRINTERLHTSELGVRDWRFGGPEISIAHDGSFVLVWQDNGAQRCNNSNIILRRFDADGKPLGAPFRVNSDPELAHFFPAVDHDAGGNFVVVWQQGALIDTRRERGIIWGQRFDSEGQRTGEPVLISSGEGLASAPTLSVAADGSYAVAWHDRRAKSDHSKILVRYADAEGNIGPEVEAGTTSLGAESRPSVVITTDKTINGLWSSKTEDPWVGTVIHSRSFTPDEQPLSTPTTIRPATCRDRQMPRAVAMPNGDLVAVWQVDFSHAVEGVRLRPSGRSVGMTSPGPTIAQQTQALLPTEDLFPDAADRRQAAEDLGCFRFEAAGARSTLEAVLANDRDPGVRGAAAYALAMVAPVPESVLQRLIEAAHDESAAVREGAARGLGVLQYPEGAKPLAGMFFNDPSPRVAATAASSLADIARSPDTSAKLRAGILDVLEWRLEHGEINDERRISTYGALSRLPNPPDDLAKTIFENLFDDFPTYALSLIGGMGRAGSPASYQVAQVLKNEDPALRVQVIRCLAKIGSGTIYTALEDPSPQVRAAAADALRHLGLGGTTAAIEKAARVEVDPIALEAVDALWNTAADAECVQAMKKTPTPTPPPTPTPVPVRYKISVLSDQTLRLFVSAHWERRVGWWQGPQMIVWTEVFAGRESAETRLKQLKSMTQEDLRTLADEKFPGWWEAAEKTPGQPMSAAEAAKQRQED